MPASEFWTADETSVLIELWPTHSASQIAKRLHRTRESVCGKTHRLQMCGRLPCQAPSKCYDVPIRRPRQPRMYKPRPRHEKVANLLTPPRKLFRRVNAPLNSRPCTLLELGRRRCKFPLGEMFDPATLFCGGRAVDGLPYCAFHAGIAYKPQPQSHEPAEPITPTAPGSQHDVRADH